jgi:hypothetical protein
MKILTVIDLGAVSEPVLFFVFNAISPVLCAAGFFDLWIDFRKKVRQS